MTGLGAVTPVGNTVEETWNSLVNGIHGIGPITQFDTTEMKAKLGAEVKNFDPRDYMEKAEILRTDRYVQFALASAVQAVITCFPNDPESCQPPLTSSFIVSFS